MSDEYVLSLEYADASAEFSANIVRSLREEPRVNILEKITNRLSAVTRRFRKKPNPILYELDAYI